MESTGELRVSQTDQPTEKEIADRISSAVMDHRLPAGTKLAENVLCETFDTSRARIRRVFLVLAERGIVELQSNRGAFVASPTREDARNVFQARRTIEPTVVRNAVRLITDNQVATLTAHLEREARAGKSGNRREIIRQSGTFHIALAEVAGNPVLRKFVEDLVARSSLIIGLFGSAHLSSCSQDEHSALIDMIAARNAKLAPGLMVDHLNRIESELELSYRTDETVDLRRVLAL